ncbi:uncharacterized protein LOC106170995 [Lingula anatina]|uniref:Nucleoporin NUP42 n=1 Tax=Lingula anatina TaxID=7574 RepID=A0A1S3J971_LINAN|nr:uncharacterized protein LOC106170995 [Lingula anatina]|eukprot:XP_013406952.1 uncharacterized protein LOC106170995 [Lingula anatina]
MSTRQELVQKQEKSGIVSVMSQASDPSPISICQFYANKRWCKFGKRCKFQHTRGSQPFSDEEDPTGAKCSDSKVDSQSLKEVAIDNATEGTDQSELQTAQVVEVFSETEKPHKLKPKVTKENAEGHKICKFFARTGRCRFGSRCYFFHERSSGEQERKGVMKENVESADAVSQYTNLDDSEPTSDHMPANSPMDHQNSNETMEVDQSWEDEGTAIGGTALCKGKFLPVDEVISLLISDSSPTLTEIPPFKKENIMFIIDNRRKAARIQAKQKHDLSDDCGVWNPSHSPLTRMAFRDGKWSQVVLKNDQYYIEKQVKNKRKLQLLGEQPNQAIT